MKILRYAALAALLPCLAHAFSFDDVHFWTGEGTNRAAVVIDWGCDDASAVLAWGYRWNGAATAADAILAIAGADPRLDVAHSPSDYGFYPTGFTYRATGGDIYEAVAEDYYDESGMTGTYWSLSSAPSGGAMEYASVGASSLALQPGGRVGLKWTWYSFDYATYAYDGGDTSVAENVAVAAPTPPFAPSDVHFWAGEGTNRAVVVIDWNRPDASSRAWGYRWNGDPVPVARAIADIAREDNRLHYVSSQSQWGTSVDAFGYDRADVAAAFDAAAATASDAAALFGV